MARVRSPNFPVIGLSKAIDRARTIFDKEQQLPANRDVLSKHLGYSGYNGKSAKVLSALSKYGLLETSKDQKLRVSQRAMRILFPRNEADKTEALREAAAGPVLFRDIATEWDGGVPSDENLANYLLHNGFSQSAISPAISAYRDTISLIAPQKEQYPISEDDDFEEPDSKDENQEDDRRHIPARGGKIERKPPKIENEPFALQLVKGGILGSFDLRNKADLETFVAGLQALKSFLPEEDEFDQLLNDD